MIESIFLVLAGISLLTTLLFLLSASELSRLSKAVDRPVRPKVFSDERFNIIKDVFDKDINTSRWIIKYRIPFAGLSFIATIFLLWSAVYKLSFYLTRVNSAVSGE